VSNLLTSQYSRLHSHRITRDSTHPSLINVNSNSEKIFKTSSVADYSSH